MKRIYSTLVGALFSLVPMSGFLSPASAHPINGTSISTLDIVSSTFHTESGPLSATNTPTKCLDYCVTGWCVFFSCTWNLGDTAPTCSFPIAPRITHYNPDLVVSAFTYDATGQSQNPWDLARMVDNAVINTAANPIVRLLAGPLVGQTGLGTGNRQANARTMVKRKEVSIWGHPMATAIEQANMTPEYSQGQSRAANNTAEILRDYRETVQRLRTAGEEQGNAANGTNTGQQTTVYPRSFYNFARNAAPWLAMLDPAFGIAITTFEVIDTIDYIRDTVQSAIAAAELIRRLKAGLSLGIVNFDISVLCRPTARSFQPYYFSALDPLAWRLALPEMFYYQALIPGMQEVGTYAGPVPLFSWGNIYPRSGSLGTTNDDKAGAVFAFRAAHFVTRLSQPHIYIPLVRGAGYGEELPGGLEVSNGASKWQQLYPVMENTCRVFGDTPDFPPTSDTINPSVAAQKANPANIFSGKETGNYTWALWRRYTCCTNELGIFWGTYNLETPSCLNSLLSIF